MMASLVQSGASAVQEREGEDPTDAGSAGFAIQGQSPRPACFATSCTVLVRAGCANGAAPSDCGGVQGRVVVTVGSTSQECPVAGGSLTFSGFTGALCRC
jgi:hypothetical protein